MSDNKPALLILAAGMGSRYGGLKQLDGIGPCGETIMDYSVFDAIRAGFGKIIFIIRENFREEFEKRAKDVYGNYCSSMRFVEQELDMLPEGFIPSESRIKPWGTGHAVMVAEKEINTPFAVINADDFYGSSSFKVLYDFLSTAWGKKGKYCMIGFAAANTLSPSGSVSRGICNVDKEGMLISVQETHNIFRDNDVVFGDNPFGERISIKEETPVSMNMWGFTPDIFLKGAGLFSEFLKMNIENEKAEFYIPSVVDTLLKRGEATCKVLNTDEKWFGVTYKDDREFAVSSIIIHTQAGHYPSPLFK